MRSNHWLLVLGFMILVSMGAITVHAGKDKSDRERIAVLEQQVMDLSESVGSTQADLATALETDKDQDKRLEQSNGREWDLHQRVLKLEGRSPVAKRQ